MAGGRRQPGLAVGGPARLFGGAEGLRPVAGPVAEEQFVQARILEVRAQPGQRLRPGAADAVHPGAVLAGKEAAGVQGQVRIRRGRRARTREGCQHPRPERRLGRQGLGPRPGRGQVHLVAFRHRWGEHAQIPHHHGAAVQVQGLGGQPRQALAVQRLAALEDPLAQHLRIQVQERLEGVAQVPYGDLVGPTRLVAQRQDQGEGALLRLEHAGHVDERLGVVRVYLAAHPVLVPGLQGEVPEPGLALLEPARQGDRRLHVCQGGMRLGVRDTVGGGEVLQAEAGGAVRTVRPDQPLRPEGPGQAQHVQQVPAAVAVLPLPGVGIDEVAEQGGAGEFVVEAQAVVADRAGLGPGKLLVHGADEGLFLDPQARHGARADAGEGAGHRIRQVVGAEPAPQFQRRLHRHQIGVGAQAGELGRAVRPGVHPEGLIIVPVERACHACEDTSCRSRR